MNSKHAVGNFLRKAKLALGIEGSSNHHAFGHGAGGELDYNQAKNVKRLLLGHGG